MIAESIRSTRTARHHANNKILKRGMACLNCRQFKVKCDGQKPVCGPCMHHPRRDECDYDDGPGPTKMRQLEEEIARLRQQVFDLENPGASTPTVTLHDPYFPYHQSQKLRVTIPSQPPPHPSSPYSPISPASSNGVQSSIATLPMPLIRPPAYSIGGSRPSPAPTFLGTSEPSYHIQQTLIEKFLPFSIEFGFFLSPDQFFNAALHTANFGDSQRPTPALLSAVYLWGAYLSGEELFTRHESVFLTRALQFAATDIISDHPNKVLHTLQAQVLLAYYFLRTGRLVEAKMQTASAMTLALENGLHQLQPSSSSQTFAFSPDGSLSPTQEPTHTRSDGDYISAWWTIFGLHKMISAGLDSSASYFGVIDTLRMQIDTPWPMDFDQYQTGAVPNASKNTVRDFLLNGSSTEAEGSSISAMCAKATVLYHRATQIADQASRFSTGQHEQAYWTTLTTTRNILEHFRRQLPSLDGRSEGTSTNRQLVFVHSLANAALAKLSTQYHKGAGTQGTEHVEAARKIIEIGANWHNDLHFMNPFYKTLWSAAVRTIMESYSGATYIEMPFDEHVHEGQRLLELSSQRNGYIQYDVNTLERPGQSHWGN